MRNKMRAKLGGQELKYKNGLGQAWAQMQKNKLGDKINFCMKINAKTNFVVYYFCLLKFHALLCVSSPNSPKLTKFAP